MKYQSLNRLLLEIVQNPESKITDITQVLDSGADIGTQDARGRSLLAIAIAFGRDDDIIKLLLERNVKPSKKDAEQEAIRYTCDNQNVLEQQQLKISNLLKLHEITFNSQISYDAKATTYVLGASLIEHPRLLHPEMLTPNNAAQDIVKANHPSDDISSTVARSTNERNFLPDQGCIRLSAAACEHLTCRDMLILDRALIRAVANPNGWMLEELLKKGASANAVSGGFTQLDKDSRTALMIATTTGNANNVEILLRYGANVNVIDLNNKTAIDMATALPTNEILDMLLQVNAKSQDAWKNICHPIYGDDESIPSSSMNNDRDNGNKPKRLKPDVNPFVKW